MADNQSVRPRGVTQPLSWLIWCAVIPLNRAGLPVWAVGAGDPGGPDPAS